FDYFNHERQRAQKRDQEDSCFSGSGIHLAAHLFVGGHVRDQWDEALSSQQWRRGSASNMDMRLAGAGTRYARSAWGKDHLAKDCKNPCRCRGCDGEGHLSMLVVFHSPPSPVGYGGRMTSPNEAVYLDGTETIGGGQNGRERPPLLIQVMFYRPPCPLGNFIDKLDTLLCLFSVDGSSFLLLCDFNLPSDKLQSSCLEPLYFASLAACLGLGDNILSRSSAHSDGIYEDREAPSAQGPIEKDGLATEDNWLWDIPF
ncbi:hypothetical protein NFI96_015939, partial [Prochilodus magdalenae]